MYKLLYYSKYMPKYELTHDAAPIWWFAHTLCRQVSRKKCPDRKKNRRPNLCGFYTSVQTRILLSFAFSLVLYFLYECLRKSAQLLCASFTQYFILSRVINACHSWLSSRSHKIVHMHIKKLY